MNTIVYCITIILFIYCIILKVKNLKYKSSFKKFESEIELLSKHHSIKDIFASNIVSMVDANEFLAMWIKNEKDRYIYANKTLRTMLFNNKSLCDIIGKNDIEIAENISMVDDETLTIIDNLTPEDLIDIDQQWLDSPTKICNLTDIITKSFRSPCRFFEVVNNLALDVYKCPVYNQKGDIIATAGSLIDITEKKQKKINEVTQLVKEGKAFPIGKTQNFYLLRDYCDIFTCF